MNDTVDYRNAARGVSVSLLRGAGDDGEGGRDSYVDVEDVIGSRHSDTIEGNNVANVLNGLEGNDRLVGQGGNDTLFGGLGNDGLYGGADHDTIYGGDGDDTVSGGTGNDTVSGGNGNDTFRGDAGADAINGGSGSDTVDFSASPEAPPVFGITGVFVNLSETEGAVGDANGDTYVGIENVHGSAYVDWLIGNDEVNELLGNGGDDLIAGGAGADTLAGGDGNDLVSYWNSTAGVSIDLNENEASGGDAAGDTISGFENAIGSEYVDVLFGSNEGNMLSGLGAGDFIDGDDGEDEVEGGEGDDSLIGGAHADTFVFTSFWSDLHDGNDVIIDFSVGTDMIEFRGGEVDSIDDLQFVQYGAHTVIGYGVGNDLGAIWLYGVNAEQLLQQADTTFLFS